MNLDFTTYFLNVKHAKTREETRRDVKKKITKIPFFFRVFRGFQI